MTAFRELTALDSNDAASIQVDSSGLKKLFSHGIRRFCSGSANKALGVPKVNTMFKCFSLFCRTKSIKIRALVPGSNNAQPQPLFCPSAQDPKLEDFYAILRFYWAEAEGAGETAESCEGELEDPYQLADNEDGDVLDEGECGDDDDDEPEPAAAGERVEVSTGDIFHDDVVETDESSKDPMHGEGHDPSAPVEDEKVAPSVSKKDPKENHEPASATVSPPPTAKSQNSMPPPPPPQKSEKGDTDHMSVEWVKKRAELLRSLDQFIIYDFCCFTKLISQSLFLKPLSTHSLLSCPSLDTKVSASCEGSSKRKGQDCGMCLSMLLSRAFVS